MSMATSGNDLELWHVQLGGSVRTMTLDELDEAFQSGTVNERTMVLKAGALHWTTLGDVAGLETADAQPNSIAPMATDIASSNAVIPTLPAPTFDVSFGTEELRVFRPKRRIGRVFAAVAAVAVVGGAIAGVRSYGIDRLEEQVASFASLVKSETGESARAVAVVQPPPAEPATNANATASPPPQATPVESLPSVKVATPSVSIDSLPSAPPEKASKRRRSRTEPAPRKKAGFARAKGKGKSSSDPTQRGGGQFDPLNGNL